MPPPPCEEGLNAPRRTRGALNVRVYFFDDAVHDAAAHLEETPVYRPDARRAVLSYERDDGNNVRVALQHPP